MLANDEIRDTSDELGTTLHAQSGESAIAAEALMNIAGLGRVAPPDYRGGFARGKRFADTWSLSYVL